MTVREMADRVVTLRQAAWAKADPTTAIVAAEQLGPEDEAAVRRVVAEAGYQGAELEEMVRQVSARVVGDVEALADRLPATGGD
jgi:hypothetical protein